MDAVVPDRETEDFRTIASEKDCLGYLGSTGRWLNCPNDGNGRGARLDLIRLRIRRRTRTNRAIKATPPATPPAIAATGVFEGGFAVDGAIEGFEG